MTQNISRRDMIKFSGLTAAAVGAGVLAGCTTPSAGTAETQAEPEAATTAESTAAPAAASVPTTAAGNYIPPFFQAPEPITDIAEEKDYDVVVVGAGAAGVCAAYSAFQQGASVALLQKTATAVSQGNTCNSVNVDESDAAGVQALISRVTEDCCHRSSREQVELWALNSYEALKWLWDISEKAGAQITETTERWVGPIKQIDGYNVNYFAFDYGPKPYNTGNGMQDVAAYIEGEGVEIFYETPAAQLVTEGGKVTGVIATSKDGNNIQFNATKGVIMATGDYENDDAMMDYYNPDVKNLWRKEDNKTGDGQKMMVWAGAQMEPVCGAKVLHDFDAGPGSMADMPFLCVKNDGTRFCNEKRSEMAVMGNFLTSEEDSGWYTQVFDSNYMTDCADWPGALLPPEAMANYMPEVEGEKTGVYTALINTYSADTIEELGEKLGIDAAEFAKTVERYNELCEKGADDDFGKAAQWLVAIKQPPFYGIHRHIGVSTIIHGVNVDGEMRVLDADGKVIEGLWAVGNCAGGFFGSPDYPMTCPGMSLGRAHTQGYVVGRAVASA